MGFRPRARRADRLNGSKVWLPPARASSCAQASRLTSTRRATEAEIGSLSVFQPSQALRTSGPTNAIASSVRLSLAAACAARTVQSNSARNATSLERSSSGGDWMIWCSTCQSESEGSSSGGARPSMTASNTSLDIIGLNCRTTLLRVVDVSLLVRVIPRHKSRRAACRSPA